MGTPMYDRFWGAALRTTRSLHGVIDRVSGGRLMRSLPGGAPVVWIWTLGRRSSEWRRTPLIGVFDGSGWIVAGSNAGQEAVPAWVHNVRAHDRGRIEVAGSTRDARFVELTGEDRTTAYARLVDAWSAFAMYERNAQREIPVFRIEPIIE